ncbi:MAG TPA: leucine-rich repeat domain-containing protein, partial [Pseudomonadales bacterium]|nr:leucine-rich repeat domain-containing protein [Pseudomonadales bacterium]
MDLKTKVPALLAALILGLPIAAQAQFTYFTNADNTITITRYAGSSAEVAIPASINGLPVTSIGAFAFDYNSSLTGITIPNSIINIGSYAFSDCDHLNSVTIPDGVINIGNDAFQSCYSLTNVTIPESVTNIELGAFNGCAGLIAINVDVANSFYSSVHGVLFDKDQATLIQYPIGNMAAYYTIPDSVTNIGDGAFQYSYGLTNVTIPNSVFNIGNYAFQSCYDLTNVTIPGSVTNIAFGVFELCRGLIAINVDATNSFYSSIHGALFDKDQTTLIQYPIGNTALSYTIPDSVTNIGEDAFSSCINLNHVTIPESVISIGDGAFAATALTCVKIPDSVECIGSLNSLSAGAFVNCNNLTNITIGNHVTSIGSDTFAGCYN